MTTRHSPTIRTRGAIAGAAIAGAAALLSVGVPSALAASDEAGSDRFPISVDQMDARRTEIFAMVDTNGDGLISAEEFAAAEMPKRDHRRHKGHRGQRGEAAGEQPTGERAEKRASMDEDLFLALDSDADGVISREEFSTRAMRDAQRASMKSHMFERADQDGDGYLSPEEFPPRRMAQLDANGDGEITRDEMRNHSGRHSWGGDAG